MKRYIKTFFIIVLGFGLLFSFLYKNYNTTFAQNNINKTIIIDAGHGGFDSGAIAFDNTLEKDLNLSISKKLESVLSVYGYNIILTRDSDNPVSINTNDSSVTKSQDMNSRVEIMKQYPDAIFISIHQNKFSEEYVKGFQTFYNNNANSKLLAESIQDSVVSNLQPSNHRVAKEDDRDVYILKNATIPAVIIECGFMSNNEELRLLKEENYQNQLAITIADGILNFYNNS